MRTVRHRAELPRLATILPKSSRDSQKGGKGRKRDLARSRPLPLTWDEASATAIEAGGTRYTIPVPERTNAVWRQYRGRTIVSAKHRADKASAPLAFARCRPCPGECRVSIVWYRQRRAGDVDGRLKAALDLLRGIAYRDDAQVCAVSIARVDDETQPARLEVSVWPS